MNYNRYVVCRSMDGLSGRDLICPTHGKDSEDCHLVVTAPVEELKDAQINAREQFRYARKMRDANIALEFEIGELREQIEERKRMQTEWKTRSIERVGIQMSALGDLRYDYILEARYLKEGVNPGHPPIYEYTLRIVEKS